MNKNTARMMSTSLGVIWSSYYVKDTQNDAQTMK